MSVSEQGGGSFIEVLQGAALVNHDPVRRGLNEGAISGGRVGQVGSGALERSPDAAEQGCHD